MTEKLGAGRVILAVVLGGAVVTYGGVSLFVAFFVIAPMAQTLFRAAGIPRRLMPAAIMLGTATFTMSAMPGTPSIQNTIPMPFFGTTPFAAPGLGVIASLIMLGFGLWWLQREEAAAKARGEGFGDGDLKSAETLADDDTLRERASTAHEFDPAEIAHGTVAPEGPSFAAAAAPIVVVILVNLVLSLIVFPRLDLSFLAKPEWGGTSPAAVTGVWSVIAALTCAILTVLALNVRRIPDLRATMDAGVNASALPVINVASLVGFGAVVAALPAFAMVRDAVLGIGGGPLVSLAVATNILAALTGSASGGLTIALDALGSTFLAARGADRHGPGAPPPRRGDQLGNPRQPAAQRRGRDAALGLRLEPRRGVQGRVRRRHRRRPDRARRRDRARVAGRVVLRAALLPDQGRSAPVRTSFSSVQTSFSTRSACVQHPKQAPYPPVSSSVFKGLRRCLRKKRNNSKLTLAQALHDPPLPRRPGDPRTRHCVHGHPRLAARRCPVRPTGKNIA